MNLLFRYEKQRRGAHKLRPNYYRATILGQWYKGISVFDALIHELQAINDLCSLMGRPPLFRQDFRDAKKPKGFAFLLRLTAKEFEEFVHLLDKLLSDNIRKDFFQNDITDTTTTTSKDRKTTVTAKGTITMLDEWLTARFHTPDPSPLQEAITTFRKVRKLRQQPAHALTTDRFDQK